MSYRYERKTASIFSQEDIKRAILLEHSTVKWTVWKAVVATAFCGGLRGAELRSISKGSVRVDERGVWIKYYQAKQKGEVKENQFLVPFGDSASFGMCLVRYLELRRKSEPDLGDAEPLFLRVCKNGLGRQPMGQNHLGYISRSLAKELGLPKPHTYTGHSYRRSAATAAASNGATSVMMKGQFGWVQEATALKYIDVTEERPSRMAELLTGQKIARPGGPLPVPAGNAVTSSPENANVRPNIPPADTSMEALVAKFESALNLTSIGNGNGLTGRTYNGPLAHALGALASTGIPATVILGAKSGERISVTVEGGNLNISNN